jgi:putative pyruvate formate lyase activating enzyme
MTAFEPPYARLARSGELARRAAEARRLMSPCRLCPRGCGVDRAAGGMGFCRTGTLARVSHAGPHFGESRLCAARAGRHVFSPCATWRASLQNHQISQGESGER